MTQKDMSPMAIVKSNTLIDTSYKLNSREQFFVLFLVSQIAQTDEDFKTYKLHYTDIQKIVNFDGRKRIAKKEEVFAMVRNLNSNPIYYENEEVEGLSTWVTNVERKKETDMFTFTFSEKLKPYLLQLKKQFTKYNIQNIVYLSGHGIRLYEVLKRHQFKGKCVLTLEKVKFYLGIEGQYKEYYELKRRVLLPAQKDFAKYTDLQFSFQPAQKKGKKVISLEFVISENEPKFKPNEIHVFKQSADGDAWVFEITRQETLPLAKKKSKKTTAHQEKLQALSHWQLKAYRFLSEDKGVNKAFVVEKVLSHANMKYEPLIGFEDMYVKFLWNFLNRKSNAQKKAGAFVSWWKLEKLTEANLHAQLLEMVNKRKKAINGSELDERYLTARMMVKEYEEWKQSQNDSSNSNNEELVDIEVTNQNKVEYVSETKFSSVESIMQNFSFGEKIPKSNKEFDFEEFQQESPQAYQEAIQRAKELIERMLELKPNLSNKEIESKKSEYTEHICRKCFKEWELLNNKDFSPKDFSF